MFWLPRFIFANLFEFVFHNSAWNSLHVIYLYILKSVKIFKQRVFGLSAPGPHIWPVAFISGTHHLVPGPPKNFQSSQPAPTQSPVTKIMCTLLWMVHWLFKPCWVTPATCICVKETALLFNVHWNCFANFILCPTGKYMFKVKNEKIRLICWMRSKLMKFKVQHDIVLVFFLLTLTRVSI